MRCSCSTRSAAFLEPPRHARRLRMPASCPGVHPSARLSGLRAVSENMPPRILARGPRRRAAATRACDRPPAPHDGPPGDFRARLRCRARSAPHRSGTGMTKLRKTSLVPGGSVTRLRRLRRRDRGAELPAVIPTSAAAADRRLVPRALRRLTHCCDSPDIRSDKRRSFGEFAVARLGQPRRHRVIFRRRQDLPRAAATSRYSIEAERRDRAGTMAAARSAPR